MIKEIKNNSNIINFDRILEFSEIEKFDFVKYFSEYLHKKFKKLENEEEIELKTKQANLVISQLIKAITRDPTKNTYSSMSLLEKEIFLENIFIDKELLEEFNKANE